MQITENFSLEELTRTSKDVENVPDARAAVNLTLLTINILQPLREAYGKPIMVTSGFRSRRVNQMVGGVADSQHITGQAVDIKALTPNGHTLPTVLQQIENKRLFALIRELGLPFDQLIDEHDYRWIHVSFSPLHRRQVLHSV